MKSFVIEGLGWYGVGAILTAYALVSFHFLTVDSVWYQLLNATGAIGIMVDAWYAKNYQPVVLNVVWLVIALVAITGMLLPG